MGHQGQMFGKHLVGCLVVESPVRAVVIIAIQITRQASVEFSHIVKQQVFPVVHSFFLHGAVEPFIEGIHFRAALVGVAMAPPPCFRVVGESPLKFAPVVAEHLFNTSRKYCFDQCREMHRALAVVARRRHCKAKAAGMIGRRKNVAAGTPDKTNHRIKRDAVSRIIGVESFARALLSVVPPRLDFPFRRQTGSASNRLA